MASYTKTEFLLELNELKANTSTIPSVEFCEYFLTEIEAHERNASCLTDNLEEYEIIIWNHLIEVCEYDNIINLQKFVNDIKLGFYFKEYDL